MNTASYNIHAWLLISLLSVPGTLSGCQSAVSQVAVNGAVTFDSEPVEDGQVAFEPLSAGKMHFGVITNGKYSIPREYGLPPGQYRVRITASRSTGKLAQTNSFISEDMSREIKDEFIPAKYNTASELTITVEPVAEETHDFLLTS